MHSVHLGPKISGVEIAFLSVWCRGYSLNYTLWCIGAIKMQISAHGSFGLYASGVRQASTLAYLYQYTGVPPA